MKTKKELNALRKEVEDLNQKLTELSDDELEEVRAGFIGAPAVISTGIMILPVFAKLQVWSEGDQILLHGTKAQGNNGTIIVSNNEEINK